MFLLNSRYPLFFETTRPFFSQSYEVNLPSSFNTITPYTLVYSTYKLVLVLIQLLVKFFPILAKGCFLVKKQCLICYIL